MIKKGIGAMKNGPQNLEQCGWVIDVYRNYFKPNRLPIPYEQQGLLVYFTYEDLMEDKTCQKADSQLTRIRLEQIKPCQLTRIRHNRISNV